MTVEYELPVVLGLAVQHEPWVAHANCLGLDPNLFFPERGESSTEAKAVCAGCVVRAACLQYALDNKFKNGVWGGLSERQRRVLRRKVS